MPARSAATFIACWIPRGDIFLAFTEKKYHLPSEPVFFALFYLNQYLILLITKYISTQCDLYRKVVELTNMNHHFKEVS